VLLAAGLLIAIAFPARSDARSHSTLWDWLADRRRIHILALQVGETS
jgi:hypothetical protein